MVTCTLAPSVPHLISRSCSSPRTFGVGFPQTPPRDDALALLLAFGSANTWRKDLPLTSSVPCPAHTHKLSSPARRVGHEVAEANVRAGSAAAPDCVKTRHFRNCASIEST